MILIQNIEKKAFFVPNVKILSLHGTLHFDWLKGAALKYDNNFSNLKPEITQIRHFSFQVWKMLVLYKTLLNDKHIRGCLKCLNMRETLRV